MFEQFSERSRRVIFLARMNAGRRGAAAIEPVHLLDAIVREDQKTEAKWQQSSQ